MSFPGKECRLRDSKTSQLNPRCEWLLVLQQESLQSNLTQNQTMLVQWDIGHSLVVVHPYSLCYKGTRDQPSIVVDDKALYADMCRPYRDMYRADSSSLALD